jgi:hypothetical protein
MKIFNKLGFFCLVLLNAQLLVAQSVSNLLVDGEGILDHCAISTKDDSNNGDSILLKSLGKNVINNLVITCEPPVTPGGQCGNKDLEGSDINETLSQAVAENPASFQKRCNDRRAELLMEKSKTNKCKATNGSCDFYSDGTETETCVFNEWRNKAGNGGIDFKGNTPNMTCEIKDSIVCYYNCKDCAQASKTNVNSIVTTK